jgi:inhibitor of Bruton tyrosine kinase
MPWIPRVTGRHYTGHCTTETFPLRERYDLSSKTVHGTEFFSLLLLQRPEFDQSVKDNEGYTAFDVFNSTIHGTKPSQSLRSGDLYVWGANRSVPYISTEHRYNPFNRNAVLGIGDGSDRTYPDIIQVSRKDDTSISEEHGQIARFQPLQVQQIEMSKLHTGKFT